ncbi:Bug family tripartite tricarboxylate transporter substrate binding protein [Falsiroseomonas selenitidurans]|uniref:Tripartite tricarboxylate transporter substrate binding protein n=1 Tax=Falsiroseomonas selenitidurans TaxID=2716335 RepID=A0ABX1E4V1_9PROT|nr:tripartite tricarboxylate transporter substrate binding protein [Falsiroseomonas selenitidurans]NKC30833.1 tripartite tricarboxylate transporter substrate binding protein [Falsiroseomonas selenitidurans]
MTTRRQILAAALATPLAAPALAQAPWPNRPVRILNPYAPGGTSDLIIRPLTERLERAFGRPFVVENKPGAGGTVATAEGARAMADGHTLLVSNTGPLAIAPSLFRNLAYDPARAFTWVSMLGGAPIVCAVKGDSPLADMAAYKALAAKQAEEVSFGSSGVGSVGHLTGVMWGLEAGVKMLHVPFRGAAEAQQNVLGGNTTSLWDTSGANAAAIRAGSLKGLAVSSPQRIAALPAVPTLAEVGFPGSTATNWFCLAAPAGLDPAIAAKLDAEIRAGLAEAAIRTRLEGIGVVPLEITAAAMPAFVAGEVTRWGNVVRAAGVQPN